MGSSERLLEIRVPDDAAGTRLDRFLAEPLGSRAQAQGLIDSERVRVDGRVRPKRHTVKGGELIGRATTRAGRGRRRRHRPISRSRTRTTICSSSTSPPGSSCIPRGETGRGRCPRRSRVSRPAGKSPGAPGSCTGSIATPPGCSSSPRATRCTGHSSRCWRAGCCAASTRRSSTDTRQRERGRSTRRSDVTGATGR